MSFNKTQITSPISVCIRYFLVADTQYHLDKGEGVRLCNGGGAGYSTRSISGAPFSRGFAHATVNASHICRECARLDANNGLPSVSQEVVPNRESVSTRVGDSVWVEYTTELSTDGRIVTLGLPNGYRYPIYSIFWNQFRVSDRDSIRQAINSEEAQRGESQRSRIFYETISNIRNRIRTEQARVQRQGYSSISGTGNIVNWWNT